MKKVGWANFLVQSKHAAEWQRKALEQACTSGYDVFQDCITFDVSKVEERILASLTLDPLTELVLKLPRRHPLRFALLYGSGPRTLERLAITALREFSVTGQFKADAARLKSYLEAVRLECEIEAFENWQSNATSDALTRRRKENAAIAYAAMEAGIITGTRPRQPRSSHGCVGNWPFPEPAGTTALGTGPESPVPGRGYSAGLR